LKISFEHVFIEFLKLFLLAIFGIKMCLHSLTTANFEWSVQHFIFSLKFGAA